MTNHKGQPRPPSQPTNARDTVGQKHTHPKVREPKQTPPQLEHPDTGCRTPKGKQRKGEPRWHKVKNQEVYQDTANPTLNVHCRSSSANLSQLGVEPEKGSQLHDTQRKTAGAPGKRQSSYTKRGLARAYPTPSRRRGRRHSSAATERKKPYTHIQGPPEMGARS